ncbi:MAG: hypothetical protein MJA32_01970 [Proteobacteria bacterium]|nr:hypothetical protein [Pseudomonadota bacterium]
MKVFWKVVGVLLLVWVAWDLYAGYTLLNKVVYRAQEPTLYWTAVAIRFGLGVSCFFSWKN